jgi:hypothetical protein
MRHDEREPLNLDAYDPDWIKGPRKIVRVERRDGPTPAGGAYSEAHTAQDGTAVEIVEYDADGRAIARTYASRPTGEGES